MPTSKKHIHKIVITVFDGVSLADFAAPCEIFGRVRLADGHAPYRISLCASNPRVTTAHCELVVEHGLASLRDADTIIVPGIDQIDRKLPDKLLAAIKRHANRPIRIASICTGAFVLAQAGLLDGLSATTHWLAAAELARRYPLIAVDPNVLFIDNGRIFTSAGASAGLDLCLHLIHQDYGASVAALSAKTAVMPLERSGGQAQFIQHQEARHTGSLEPLLTWAQNNLSLDLRVVALAARANVSVRSLHRRFDQQVSMSPASWVLKARLRRAQNLLETTHLSIEHVAVESGFGSSSAFRERFLAALKTPPSSYRRAFKPV